MDGRARTDTLSLAAMTWATTAPIWLFISVTPHWLEAVLSDLNGDSAVLNLGVVISCSPDLADMMAASIGLASGGTGVVPPEDDRVVTGSAPLELRGGGR